MAIEDDFSVAVNGDIRYTGSGANYTVLALHRFLQNLADDAQASGDDLVDITSETPSDRSTDAIITLNSPYNIDDTAARHLYAGSITQADGDTLYSGVQILGPVETGTEVMVVQDDKVLPAYWGTGINANAGLNIVTRMLIKSRDGGADIDGKRILTRVAELGDGYKEFSVTLGLGEAVSALGNGADLNNGTADATIETWSSITNTEGFQLIDINNDGTDEEYYSQFNIGTQTVNDTYERSKWVQQRAHVADSGADVGNDFIVDNATITGQGHEFSARGQAEILREMRFQLKIGAGTPTGDLTAELYDSDDAATAAPTGAVLATSEPVLASLITSTYQEIIFRFNDNVTLTASQEYFCVIRHANGDASNYFHVRGQSAGGSDDGNRAEDSGGWTGSGTDNLWFSVKSSPVWHERAGELMRGITHEIVYDTEVGGPFTEDEIVFWGSQITYDNIASGPFVVGDYVTFEPSGGGAVKVGGKILKQTGTVLTVALDDISGSLVADNDIIRVVGKATTADVNVTITDDDKGGGEGVLLALDDNGTDGDLYIQRIHGVAPVDNLQIEGRTSGATCLVNVTVTGRAITPEFIGASTGTNIIGAYGIGFETADVSANDLLTALDNVARNPPNNVTFTVTGLVSGEDRVLVGPRTAGALDTAQFTTDTTLSTNQETAVSIATVAIPTDTPGSGSGTSNTRLRVQLDSGVFMRQPYDSYDAATPGNFTLPTSANSAVQIDVAQPGGGVATWTRASGDWFADGFDVGATFEGANFTNAGNNSPNEYTVISMTATVLTTLVGSSVVETGSGDEVLTIQGWDYSSDNATSGNDVFIAYIDVLADATSEAFTAVYNADRDLFVRVRDGGSTPIKTFESDAAVFGSVSSSVASIRQSDA